MLSYQIQIHQGKITNIPMFAWNSATPFMVPPVGTFIDIPGHGGAMKVTNVAFNLLQNSPHTMVQILYVVV